MGGRLLKRWISAPLRKLEAITKRLEAVDELYKNRKLRENLLNELKEVGDLERLISKVCTGKVNPRELVYIKGSLKKMPLIKQLIESSSSGTLLEISNRIKDLEHLVEKIEFSISDNPQLQFWMEM